ncbi:MAG: hypothetical protein M1838_005342 [Thelocarpon superellum]|nr:MAG: hypothetical protein M1838_005342 [Thelocarpon superellum]
MAWGSQSTPPPPTSAFVKLLPLIILFFVLGAFAFVGYHCYAIMNSIADSTNKKLEKKHVVFTKDGMKVGVKELNTENYVDRTQSVLVKAWNYSTWPAYRSRFWNKEAQVAEPRKAYDARSENTSGNEG